MEISTAPTWKPNMEITLHRDGTVSLWDVHAQQWTRTDAPSGDQYRAQTERDRHRIDLHLARYSAAIAR